MFYGFTEVYHVNVNNALELANQSVHYIISDNLLFYTIPTAQKLTKS